MGKIKYKINPNKFLKLLFKNKYLLFHRTRTSLLSNKDKKTPVCNVLTEKLTLHVASFSKMCTSQTVFHLEHQLYKISAFGPCQRCR